MERLTKRNENGSISLRFDCQKGCEYLTCNMDEGYQCQHQCEGDIICKLADYEDAEEQGSLLMLPCKVGDYVFYIVVGGRKNIIKKTKVVKIVIRNTIEIHCEYTVLAPGQVFSTYEEAKRRLQDIEDEESCV